MTAKDRKHRALILEAMQSAVSRALERHKRLGESIAVWRDGRVVVLRPHQIKVRRRSAGSNRP